MLKKSTSSFSFKLGEKVQLKATNSSNNRERQTYLVESVDGNSLILKAESYYTYPQIRRVRLLSSAAVD